MLCDRAELCGQLGLCAQVGLELGPGSECVHGRRAGTAGTRALGHWERTEGEDKASGVQVCAQMCVMVVE